MATETDLRELLFQLEDGAPTVSSVLAALAADRPTLDRPVPVTRHRRGWRVTGVAAACAAVITGIGVLSQVAHRHETGTAVNQPGRLSAAERARALVAAHQAANQVAVGHDRQALSGWPAAINAVTAVVQPGTMLATDSNTGHSCQSGTIIVVRLVGDFGDHTAGNLGGPGNTHADAAVREIDLSVDATTGLTCLSSARTEPVPLGRDDSVLYRR